MLKRIVVTSGLLVAAALANATPSHAQYMPGTSTNLSSAPVQDLMRLLGYGPSDYCGFYFWVASGSKTPPPASIMQALLPMCGWTPQNPPAGGSGDPGSGSGSGTTGSVLIGGGGSSGGGSSSGGSSSGGSSSGGSSSGGSSSGGSSSGGSSSGGSSSGGTPTGGPGGNPFGGGGNMVTPEPLSLILLGTGLAGIGGIRASRRRRRPESED